MDLAVSSRAPAHTRTRTRGHISKKHETPSSRNDDNHNDGNYNGDGESSDGLYGDNCTHDANQTKEYVAVGAAGHQNDAASGLTCTTKSRVRGGSSVKRKEQNRVAQRAFRQRQKTYFIDLEKEVVAQSSKIQTITKNNQSLIELMERLQRENIALKAAKASNFTGIALSDLTFENNESTGLNLPAVDAHSPQEVGDPNGRQHDIVPEEEVLASVQDLAPVNRRKGKQSNPNSATRQPPNAKLAAHSPFRSPLSSPYSRSVRRAFPGQFATSGPIDSSDCYRRQSSDASHGSVSQTSALAASNTPRDVSSSGASLREPTHMSVEQVTETINNATWATGEWGSSTRSSTTPRGSTSTDASASSDPLATFYLESTTNTSQQSIQQSIDHARVSKEMHHGWAAQPPCSVGLYDQHQHQRQQEEQQQQPVDLARKYSEALLRYHAQAPANPMAYGQRTAFDDPSRMSYGQTQAGAAQRDQSMVGRSLNDNIISASYNGWMNPWQGNGPDYMNASQTSLEQNMHQMYSRALAPQQRPHRQQQAQQPSIQADHQAETFAGVAPGLKSAAHGGIMPFTQNLTPIDGLGPFDDPFRPNIHDSIQSGQVWRDLGDLNCVDEQMCGIDVNDAGMTSDIPIGNPSVSL